MTTILSSSKNNWNKTWLLVIPFLFIFSVFKYSDAIFSAEMSLANEGDGLGTIAGIFALQDLVQHEGLGYVFSDLAKFSNHGQALSEAGPFSQFWKIVSVTIGYFFSPQLTYDLVGMLGYFFSAVAAFYLFSYLGANRLISLVLAIALVSMDNTIARAYSHLFGLGVMFAPILVVMTTAIASNNPSRKWLIVLALVHIFNFNVNEYYGYFGVFYTISFFIAQTAINARKVDWKELVKNLTIASIVFVSALILLYPNVIGQSLLLKLGIISEISNKGGTHVHEWGAFTFYSVQKIHALFESDISFIQNLLDKERFSNDLWEMSYRIGFVLPVSIVLICYHIVLIQGRKSVDFLLKLAPWCLATLVSLCFALSPNYKISLVSLTYEIAPMFRVATRSLLYFNIGLFSILVISLVHLISILDKKAESGERFKKYSISAFALLLVLLVHNDVSRLDFFEKIPTLKLDTQSPYTVLSDRENGILVEVPYLSPKKSPPEQSYPYLFNRLFHKKILANQIYTGSNNKKYIDDLDSLSESINQLDEGFLNKLITNGVKYFAVEDNYSQTKLTLDNSRDVELIAEEKGVSIYVVKGEKSVKENNINRFLLNMFSQRVMN
ncbi:hypothetical protein D515_00689 [Grimontia indica]|uniref:Glycosyltransferase RgtA/B/C/D-like domain-containing protein n=1 Tax=Grimontia indica TaxID=1056512 RepID=R1GVR6_9GAMM|nr:hypothetical protein [Grimontia indica]EOD80119.1 hypothetical protein D515_00689 [Grimontia indica]